MLGLDYLIIACVWSYFMTKNIGQTAIAKATGKVPASYTREQNRVKAGRAWRPITARRSAERFFVNAWDDAWESAEQIRARRHAKRTGQRREKWAAEDGKPTETPAPVTTNAKPETEPADTIPEVDSKTPEPVKAADKKPDAPEGVVHHNSPYILVPDGKKEALYQRYAMRLRNGGQPMTALAIADELGITLGHAERLEAKWADRYKQESAAGADRPPQHLLDYQAHSKCRDCGGHVELEKDPERPGQWIVRVIHSRDDCPQKPTPRQEHDQKVAELADAAQAENGDDATKPERKDADEPSLTLEERMQRAVEDRESPSPQTRPATSPAPTNATPINGTENHDVTTVNAETTGLQSALNYNAAMAEKAGEGAASVEMSIAALEQGEVGGAVTSPMAQGREHLEAAQACFKQAHDELQQHMNVREAYDATPDAGNKQFVTAE